MDRRGRGRRAEAGIVATHAACRRAAPSMRDGTDRCARRCEQARRKNERPARAGRSMDGARGRTRTDKPCGGGFSSHFGFRRRCRRHRSWSGARLHLSLAALGARRLLSTPSPCRGRRRGLARHQRGRVASRASAEFDGLHLRGFPRRAQIGLSPLRLPIPPLGHERPCRVAAVRLAGAARRAAGREYKAIALSASCPARAGAGRARTSRRRPDGTPSRRSSRRGRCAR